MRYAGMTSWDLILTPIYLLLFYVIATIIVRIKYRGTEHAKYFYWGLSLKFLGAIAFACVYQFYYGGGDTFRYFANSTTLYELAFEDTSRFLSYMSQTSIPRGTYEDLDGITNMFSSSNTFMVTRFATFFGFFSGMTYLPVTLFFSFLSFCGIWMFYITLCEIYPTVPRKYLAMPLFFIPSFFFWGSSIMQDSIVVGFLGVLIYSSYNILVRWRWRPINLLLFVISFYILVNVKEYVIIAFMPSLLIWIVFSWQRNVKNKRLKLVMRPFILVLILVGFFVLLPAFSRLSETYSLDNILEEAQITAEYIHRVSVRSGGSAYDLNIEYTPLGMIRVFPSAVNVSLFRPYLWEVKNPVMLISGLESLFFLLATIWLFFRIGFLGLIRSVYQDPFLFSALIFAVFFSFAVGATTLNFGSLARYKIPMMPFYCLILILSYYKYMLTQRAHRIAPSIAGAQN